MNLNLSKYRRSSLSRILISFFTALVILPAAQTTHATPELVFECEIFLQVAPAPVFAIEKRYSIRRHVVESEPTAEFVMDNWSQGRFENNGSLEIDVYPTEGDVVTESATEIRTFLLDGKVDVEDEIFDEAVTTAETLTFEDHKVDRFIMRLSRADGTVLTDHLTYPDSFNLDDWDQKECFVYWRAPAPVPCGVGLVCQIGLHQGVITSVTLETHDEDHGFEMNAGLNDAWVNQDAPFQGLLITVYPGLNIVFVAWFTFDSEVPAMPPMVTFGAHDQRWASGAGSIVGNKATINMELTSGGKFHSDEPTATQDSNYGTFELEFENCREGLVTFDFPGLGESGQFAISRVVDENADLCEMLAEP